MVSECASASSMKRLARRVVGIPSSRARKWSRVTRSRLSCGEYHFVCQDQKGGIDSKTSGAHHPRYQNQPVHRLINELIPLSKRVVFETCPLLGHRRKSERQRFIVFMDRTLRTKPLSLKSKDNRPGSAGLTSLAAEGRGPINRSHRQ